MGRKKKEKKKRKKNNKKNENEFKDDTRSLDGSKTKR